MKKGITSLTIALLAVSICVMLPMKVESQEYNVYYPNISYANVRSCPYTDGNGAWEGPIYDHLGDLTNNEIGVVEITELNAVYRVEVHGSGCFYLVTLTCNGITKEVSYYHDSGPQMGEETLVFDIAPSTVITFYTTIHRPENNHGFRVVWVKLYYVTVIALTADIDPDTLNVGSKGKWITAYAELPEGYDVQDVSISSMLLNDTIPAESKPTGIGDHDNDAIPDLMIKFDREEVISYILANINLTELVENRFMTITLTITGNLNDETPFQGSDTIKIILTLPGKYALLP